MSPHSTVSPLSRSRERARVRARALRRSGTDAEQALWGRLRDRQLAGHKFRRQRPIGPFFGDFVCLEKALIVELDGSQHLTAVGQRKDAARTEYLTSRGFQVLRFDDRQVLTELDAVLQTILDSLHASPPHPSPLPPAGEGVTDQERT